MRGKHKRDIGEEMEDRITPAHAGKTRRVVLESAGGRITPAHAGKTLSFSVRALSFADHPRACGENAGSTAQTVGWSGSPPRMRGKPYLRRWQRAKERITPAHAGKTSDFLE